MDKHPLRGWELLLGLIVKREARNRAPYKSLQLVCRVQSALFIGIEVILQDAMLGSRSSLDHVMPHVYHIARY